MYFPPFTPSNNDIIEQLMLLESLPYREQLYEVQKLVTAKMDIYEKAVEQDELSKITAMKKYLGMSDEEVL